MASYKQLFNPLGGDRSRGDFDYDTSSGGNASTIVNGAATLSGGTVTIIAPTVTAKSDIFLTGIATGGTPGELTVTSINPGVGFSVTSSSNVDTRKVAWLILEPSTTTVGLMIATGSLYGLTYTT